MSDPISITGGLDIGNGYVKGALRGPANRPDAKGDRKSDKIDTPSGVALVTSPADLPNPDSEALTVLTGDIFNELDASFASPLIDSSYRHLFGKRGLQAQASRLEEFDVTRDISKAEQELTKVFALGLFAAKGLRDYVIANGVLPQEQLTVSARVALALPIDEYRDHRVSYANSLKEGTHYVTIHNFETPVIVKVSFVHVVVVAEGSAAQFMISEGGPKLVGPMLKNANEVTKALGMGISLDHLKAEDVHGARNTVGIDIGEGTMNNPVYSNGKFNGDVSRTFKTGYGQALTKSMDHLSRAGVRFKSRKKLAEYLMTEPSPMKAAEYDRVKAIVRREEELLCDQLVEEFARVFDDVRYDTEVAYVFGGGAGPLREILHPLLVALVGDAFPVLYLDSSYSRHLNREGLFLAATMVEDAEEKAALAASSKAD